MSLVFSRTGSCFYASPQAEEDAEAEATNEQPTPSQSQDTIKAVDSSQEPAAEQKQGEPTEPVANDVTGQSQTVKEPSSPIPINLVLRLR